MGVAGFIIAIAPSKTLPFSPWKWHSNCQKKLIRPNCQGQASAVIGHMGHNRCHMPNGVDVRIIL